MPGRGKGEGGKGLGNGGAKSKRHRHRTGPSHEVKVVGIADPLVRPLVRPLINWRPIPFLVLDPIIAFEEASDKRDKEAENAKVSVIFSTHLVTKISTDTNCSRSRPQRRSFRSPR